MTIMVQELATPFQLEGELIKFIGNKKETKALKILVGDRAIKIKLAKESRPQIQSDCVKGDRLQIFGIQKLKEGGDKIKFKAYQIERLSCSLKCPESTPKCAKIAPVNGKILLCHKSGCAKHGGKEIYRALEEGLEKLGLKESIKIQTTGCQKRCSQAPNLIMMPSKQKYGRVYPKKINNILREHYLQLAQHHD
jgi:(2Fe-2S) ferredoxin